MPSLRAEFRVIWRWSVSLPWVSPRGSWSCLLEEKAGRDAKARWMEPWQKAKLSLCFWVLAILSFFSLRIFFFFFWTASKCLSFRIRLYIPASPLHSFSSVPPFFFPIILPFPRYLLRKQSIQKISIIIINMYLLCTRHCAECFINFVPVHVHNYAIR